MPDSSALLIGFGAAGWLGLLAYAVSVTRASTRADGRTVQHAGELRSRHEALAAKAEVAPKAAAGVLAPRPRFGQAREARRPATRRFRRAPAPAAVGAVLTYAAEAAPSGAFEDEVPSVSELRRAIATRQLVLHYQPMIELGSGHACTAEALMRWRHPERGLVPPHEFIPLCDEHGLGEELGEWALEEACTQARAWNDEGGTPIDVAVNLSARELCSPEIASIVARVLRRSGLEANRLELELTESMYADPIAAEASIVRLRALGVRIALDDFGMGFSSLGYLARFRPDTVKIDRSFTAAALESPDSAAIVSAIVAIGRQMNIEVVAEGVETKDQLAFADEQGCGRVQGWLFSRALEANAFARWRRAHESALG